MIVADHQWLPEKVRTFGMGHCPLVLGECVQGQTPERRHFLITSPIGLFSWAEFAPHAKDHLQVEPAVCWKALAAVKTYLTQHNLPLRGHLRVSTPLGSGQGFGTSTADITASLRAAAAAWNRAISPETIAMVATGIEPSDGSMYSGCVAFAHREGVLLEHLGTIPRFEALVMCTGGIVDTLEFDKRRKDFRYSVKDEEQLMLAWRMVRQANQTGDAALLARAATISARINEQLLPKPHFEEACEFVEAGGADGIMVAHSGTAVALLFDPLSRERSRERITNAKNFVASVQPSAWFETSNGNVSQNISVKYPQRDRSSPALASLVSI